LYLPEAFFDSLLIANILFFPIVGSFRLNFKRKASNSANIALDTSGDYVDGTDRGCYALMALCSKEDSGVDIGSMNLDVVLVLPAVKRKFCKLETLFDVEKSLG
jgi:hypothetical protein